MSRNRTADREAAKLNLIYLLSDLNVSLRDIAHTVGMSAEGVRKLLKRRL